MAVTSPPDKWRSVVLIAAAEVLVMSLWFVSNAILPDMSRENAITPLRQALLSSGVQAGFVSGALMVAFFGIADRFDPRSVMFISAVAASAANTILLLAAPGSDLAIAARFATGALLAGVYPVGVKLITGWGDVDRGFLVGLLVGALTLGSALPHLASILGGADWRAAVLATSGLGVLGGLLICAAALGPLHARASRFNPTVIFKAWSNRQIRLAYIGYFGHMWELYAMWAWIGAATSTSYAVTLDAEHAAAFSKTTAFAAIGIGAFACVFGGLLADRMGKARFASLAMAVSGGAAIAAALTFGGPPWLTFAIVLVWGFAIIPDSGQFTALVADAAPPGIAGSLVTLQTAIGFALTIVTVQVTPIAASVLGWPPVLAAMAAGPIVGIIAMRRLYHPSRARPPT